MNKTLVAFLALVFLSFLLAAPLKPADASTVFSDNFSNGNFERWSRSLVIRGANQIVSNEVARFIVLPPIAGTSTYSYVVKDGFTSTVNSTIVASQNVLVTNIPKGEPQGNGAIFFFYICDSTNLNGNYGNIGVGIDGSSVWSLWIGGSEVYSYCFQTAGSPPASNTWYHLVLTINNPQQTVSLAVNGVVVITALQQQFTDKTHPISLMSGMGENWWSAGTGQLELQVDNVQLNILDLDDLHGPFSIPPPVHTAKPYHNPSPAPAPTLMHTPNGSSAPSSSSPALNPASSLKQPGIGISFDLTIAQVIILAVLIVLLVAILWHKR